MTVCLYPRDGKKNTWLVPVSTGNKTFLLIICVYMKLYNNSQKTPQSESLHKVKTETVKHLVHKKRKRKGGKKGKRRRKWRNTWQKVELVSRRALEWGRAIWQEKQFFLRDYREKVPHTKYSSRQLVYTKATRIFLQHQILILYTALFLKSQCGRLCWCHRETLDLLLTQRAWEFWKGRQGGGGRQRGLMTCAFILEEIGARGASCCGAANGLMLPWVSVPHTWPNLMSWTDW